MVNRVFILVALVLLAVPVGAQEVNNTDQNRSEPVNSTSGGEDGGLLGGLVDTVKDGVVDAFNTVLSEPVQNLTNQLTDLLTGLITTYPDLTRSEALSIHSDVFRLSLLLSAAALIWIGFLHVTGSIHGIRPTVHLLAALVIGSIAPWFLQYLVRLSELVTRALVPAEPGFVEIGRFASGFVLVGLLNAMLLLGIAALFIIRDFFLIFTAVAAPLLGLAYAFPYTRRFAAPLFGVFGAFLVIGPLDIIVFRITLIFLRTEGLEFPNWLGAMAGYVLLLGIPYIVISSGMSAVGTATSFIRGSSVPEKRRGDVQSGDLVDGGEPGGKQKSVGQESGTNRFLQSQK